MKDNTLDTVLTVGMLFLLAGALNKKPEPPPAPPCTVNKDVIDNAQKMVNDALSKVSAGLEQRFDAVESAVKLASKLPPAEKEAMQVVEDMKNKAAELDKKAEEVDKQKDELKKKIKEASDSSEVAKNKDKEIEQAKKDLDSKTKDLEDKKKELDKLKLDLDKLGKECKTPGGNTSFSPIPLFKEPHTVQSSKLIAKNPGSNGGNSVINRKSNNSKIISDPEINLDKCCVPEEI